MIEIETVLILGAGASYDFGFPLGFSLYKEILTTVKGENDGIWILKKMFSQERISEFRNAYEFSGKESIDEFLQHRKDLADIGKALISIALIKKEIQSKLFSYELNKHWYRLLFAAMNTEISNFTSNKISFITFNYDRSLEHFLYLALKNTYKLEDDKVVNILRKIKIIHIHGCIGLHPCTNISALNHFHQHTFDGVNSNSPYNLTNGHWDSNSKYYRYYDSTLSHLNVQSAMQNIKIIHDEENTAELKEAIQLMNNAKRLLFLGFGYNATNLNRLKISECKCPSIWGTAYKLTQVEKEKIAFNTNNKIEEDHLLDYTIYDFLTKHMPLDFHDNRLIHEKNKKEITQLIKKIKSRR